MKTTWTLDFRRSIAESIKGFAILKLRRGFRGNKYVEIADAPKEVTDYLGAHEVLDAQGAWWYTSIVPYEDLEKSYAHQKLDGPTRLVFSVDIEYPAPPPKPRRGWINSIKELFVAIEGEDVPTDYDETDDKSVGDIIEHGISRRVYKSTSCGAWVAPIRGEWTPHGSKIARHPDGRVVGVSTGSIVEGIDACTDTHYLPFPFTAKQFWATVQAIEDEARGLWDETHGCPNCAKLVGGYGEWGSCRGNDGLTPIVSTCRQCKGRGSIL